MKVFDEGWSKLACIRIRQISKKPRGRRTVLPGPLTGERNVLRFPWGPGILVLDRRIAAIWPGSDRTFQRMYGRRVDDIDGAHGDPISKVTLKKRVKRVDANWACQNEGHFWSKHIARLRRVRRRERKKSADGMSLLKVEAKLVEHGLFES